MKKIIKIIAAIMLVTIGCQIQPDQVRYGSDACGYCHMTIVDKQHAAVLVTQKGRTEKFDAIECMVNHLKSEDENEYGLFLVTDFKAPGAMVDATEATYLISLDIPSPMGAFLSGFADKNTADNFRSKHAGQLYTWTELKTYFRNTDGIISQ